MNTECMTKFISSFIFYHFFFCVCLFSFFSCSTVLWTSIVPSFTFVAHQFSTFYCGHWYWIKDCAVFSSPVSEQRTKPTIYACPALSLSLYLSIYLSLSHMHTRARVHTHVLVHSLRSVRVAYCACCLYGSFYFIIHTHQFQNRKAELYFASLFLLVGVTAIG